MTFKMKWNSSLATSAVQAGAVKGLRDSAEFLLEEANKTCPLAPDGGTLRRSGAVDVDTAHGEATVSYNTPYAAALHEGKERNWSEPGTRAKWLQLALQENAQGIRDYLKNAIEEAFK